MRDLAVGWWARHREHRGSSIPVDYQASFGRQPKSGDLARDQSVNRCCRSAAANDRPRSPVRGCLNEQVAIIREVREEEPVKAMIQLHKLTIDANR
jgi:hypothetical protein